MLLCGYLLLLAEDLELGRGKAKRSVWYGLGAGHGHR